MGGGASGGSGQGDPLVGGAMTDRIGKLLEHVGLMIQREGTQFAKQNPRANDTDYREFAVGIMNRELGPLLRAGQAMRDEMALDPDCSQSDNRYIRAWDDALATLEDRDGK